MCPLPPLSSECCVFPWDLCWSCWNSRVIPWTCSTQTHDEFYYVVRPVWFETTLYRLLSSGYKVPRILLFDRKEDRTSELSPRTVELELDGSWVTQTLPSEIQKWWIYRLFILLILTYWCHSGIIFITFISFHWSIYCRWLPLLPQNIARLYKL